MNPSSAPTVSPPAVQFATPELNDSWAGVALDEETAESGYNQIPDTDWWEGEPGTVLEIGELTYRPIEPQASLTLAAIYGAGRRPCYWLTATQGGIIERGSGAEREIDELLLPGVQGGQIGAVAMAVGRLFAPTTPAHRLKPRLKHHAASRARLDAASLGCLFAIYQQYEGISEVELARRLWCSQEALDDLFLCLIPISCAGTIFWCGRTDVFPAEDL
jgi:hypothetical protein